MRLGDGIYTDLHDIQSSWISAEVRGTGECDGTAVHVDNPSNSALHGVSSVPVVTNTEHRSWAIQKAFGRCRTEIESPRREQRTAAASINPDEPPLLCWNGGAACEKVGAVIDGPDKWVRFEWIGVGRDPALLARTGRCGRYA